MLKKLGYMHKLFLTLKFKYVRLKVCVITVVYILIKYQVYPIYCSHEMLSLHVSVSTLDNGSVMDYTY